MGIGVVFCLIGIVGVVAAVDDITLYTPHTPPVEPIPRSCGPDSSMAKWRLDGLTDLERFAEERGMVVTDMTTVLLFFFHACKSAVAHIWKSVTHIRIRRR